MRHYTKIWYGIPPPPQGLQTIHGRSLRFLKVRLAVPTAIALPSSMAPIAYHVGLSTVRIRTRGQVDLLLPLSFLHVSPPTLVFYHPLPESLPKTHPRYVNSMLILPYPLPQEFDIIPVNMCSHARKIGDNYVLACQDCGETIERYALLTAQGLEWLTQFLELRNVGYFRKSDDQ
jgi:hypothetical protein